MKTRHTFVSNSSSSSFIIYKPLLTEDNYNTLKKWFDNNRDNMQDDNAVYWQEQNNYIIFNCNSHLYELEQLLTEMQVTQDKYCVMYS